MNVNVSPHTRRLVYVYLLGAALWLLSDIVPRIGVPTDPISLLGLVGEIVLFVAVAWTAYALR